MALTLNQKRSLLRGILAARRDEWVRAESAGERVTLASLYYAGFLERRAWRGVDGAANAAYEYRATKVVLEAWGARDR